MTNRFLARRQLAEQRERGRGFTSGQRAGRADDRSQIQLSALAGQLPDLLEPVGRPSRPEIQVGPQFGQQSPVRVDLGQPGQPGTDGCPLLRRQRPGELTELAHEASPDNRLLVTADLAHVDLPDHDHAGSAEEDKRGDQVRVGRPGGPMPKQPDRRCIHHCHRDKEQAVHYPGESGHTICRPMGDRDRIGQFWWANRIAVQQGAAHSPRLLTHFTCCCFIGCVDPRAKKAHRENNGRQQIAKDVEVLFHTVTLVEDPRSVVRH
jgi:hypothetical protein